MSAENFAALAAEVYGNFGWAAAIAGKLDVHRSTAIRWGNGQIPIPEKAWKLLHDDAEAKVAAIMRAVRGKAA